MNLEGRSPSIRYTFSVRLVLDTCIIVSAFRSLNGASRKMIDLLDQRRYEMLLSTSLLLEYEMVLTRPEQVQVHGFSLSEIATFLDTLSVRSVHVNIHYHWKPQLRDPDDELVLAAAINGNADAIVTHNIVDFLPAGLSFGMKVLTPGRIIAERFRR